MVRLASRKEGSRRPRNIVLIVTEGRTEQLYFDGLKQRGCNVLIRTTGTSDTDPVNLVKFCRQQILDNSLDLGAGDMAICVFDIDENTKQNLIRAESMAERNGISLAVSNPCFELWLALHFVDVDHPLDRREAHSLVRRHIHGYSKVANHNDVLTSLRGSAMQHADRLWSINGPKKGTTVSISNPCTSVHKVIGGIEELKRRNTAR